MRRSPSIYPASHYFPAAKVLEEPLTEQQQLLGPDHSETRKEKKTSPSGARTRRPGKVYRSHRGGSAGLVLTRTPGEKIMLGNEIVIQVLQIVGNKVRIGIQAPKSIPVYREEIWDIMHNKSTAAPVSEGDTA